MEINEFLMLNLFYVFDFTFARARIFFSYFRINFLYYYLFFKTKYNDYYLDDYTKPGTYSNEDEGTS